MRFDSKRKIVIMESKELASYAFPAEKPVLLTDKYKFIREEDNYSPESYSYAVGDVILSLPLRKESAVGDKTVCVEGSADKISFDGTVYTFEKNISLKYLRRDITPFSDPSLFPMCAINAFIFTEENSLSEIKIKLNFSAPERGHISFTALFTRVFLSRIFDSLISRASMRISSFFSRYTSLPFETEGMPFPYTSIREGQKQFINAAYRAIRNRNDLLVSAPTGIGKTISSLFPSIKAVGNGYADRVFYFTAKGITGREAIEACRRIGKYVQSLRVILLSSKEFMCSSKHKHLSFGLSCKSCEGRADLKQFEGKDFVSYRERQLSAINFLLEKYKVYTPDIIKEVAAEFKVCPHELELDISEECSVIVCDYNYSIDENIRIKRYFKNSENTERYIFLYDEAHNIPDRTRNTYSAFVDDGILFSLREAGEYFDSEFKAKVEEFADSIEDIHSMCTDGEHTYLTDNGEIVEGFYRSSSIPDSFWTSSVSLYKLIVRIMRLEPDYIELLQPIYDVLSKLNFVFGFFSDGFCFYASKQNERTFIELLCLDPSELIDSMTSAARSTIMFSATLSPIDYFSEVSGMFDADRLELQSPYEKDNLCLVAYDGMSTRYSDRRDNALECVKLISDIVSAKNGNYIVYFPSFDYMKHVCSLFVKVNKSARVAMQKEKMSYKEREKFIAYFKEENARGLVGFCVLGGLFSEGIDLRGDGLIGAIIVGTGMPQLSAERNIMSEYYDEINERGHEFAYLSPGFNKVMQAAGRVIRSETDRGIVVLIDDRYNDISIKTMFPEHWRHIKYTDDRETLAGIISGFWFDGEKHG